MICHLLVVQTFLKPSEKRRLSKVWYLDNAYFEGSSGAKKIGIAGELYEREL